MISCQWLVVSGQCTALIPTAIIPPRATAGRRNLGLATKKAPRRAPELLSFLLCRLGDGDGLARVTHLEPRKAPHGDVLTELADLRGDQLADRDGLVLDERLFEQANFLVELLHLAGDHLLGNV